MDAQHTKHVTCMLAYDFVWCPKYRKKLLVGKIAAFLEQEIRRICAENSWSIGAVNIQSDHVHLFLSAHPSVAPSQIAHTLKGTTARKVFQQFPEVKKYLWGGAFWSRSYYAGIALESVSSEDGKGRDRFRPFQKRMTCNRLSLQN